MAKMQRKVSSFIQPRTVFDGVASSNKADEDYEEEEEEESTPVI